MGGAQGHSFGIRRKTGFLRSVESRKPEGLLVEDGFVGRGQVAGHHLHEFHIHQRTARLQGQILAGAHDILSTQMIPEQTAVAAGGQNHRAAAHIAEFLLSRQYRAADPTLLLHQIQDFIAGKNLHLLFPEFLGEDLPGTVKFNAVPVPVLVVEAGDKFLLAAVVRPAKLHTHIPNPGNGRLNAGDESLHHGRLRYAAANLLNGPGQIRFVRRIRRADES